MYKAIFTEDVVCDGCGIIIRADTDCYTIERDGDLAGKGDITVCSKVCGYTFFGVGGGK